MSTLTTISGFSVIAMSWLFGLISIYCLHLFYGLKFNTAYEMIFVKRRGNLVIAYTLCSIFVLLIGYPSGLFLHWDLDFLAPITGDNRCATYILLEMIHLIDIFMYYLGATLTLLRYWMIYYDIQFSNGLLNLEWKQCISKSKAALHKDKWYIQHRNTLGNVSYVTQKAVIVIACIALFSMAMHASYTLFEIDSIHMDLTPFISPTLNLTLFVILIIIWHKMPFFDDKIYLYKEFRIVAFFWIAITFVYGCGVILNRFIIDHPVNIILSCFGHFCAVLMCFIVPFMSTFWVLNYIKRDREPVASQPDELEDMFNDADKLNQFMQHLIKEFSMECLLSVIEFQQYKGEAIKALNGDIEANDGAFSHAHVPRSDIVFDDKNVVSDDIKFGFKVKAHKLYKKYIEPRAPFELNVSAQAKYKLIGYMEHYDEWVNADDSITDLELINVFDKAHHEMIQLLNCSIMSMCMTQ
eukprot:263191_1